MSFYAHDKKLLDCDLLSRCIKVINLASGLQHMDQSLKRRVVLPSSKSLDTKLASGNNRID